MDYMTISDAAAKWGISSRRVQILCASGRISGAERLGRSWAIPKDAEKPGDARIKSGGILGFLRNIGARGSPTPHLQTVEGGRYADIGQYQSDRAL